MQIRSISLPKLLPAHSKLTDTFNYSRLDHKSRRKFIRGGIIFGNVILFVLISLFVLANQSANQTVRSSEARNLATTASNTQNPLDQVSSTQIALNISQELKLEEKVAAKNNRDSDAALLAVVPSDNGILAKPQIVATAQKSKKDIISYTVQAGDTTSSIATKFNVSTNSVKWSNNLFGDYVQTGTILFIPPTDGVVYKVKAGDTIESILGKYQNLDRSYFVSVNDIESGDLPVGQNLWLPGATVATVRTTFASAFFIGSYSPAYGSNGYDFGYCTYYVASRVAVPSNWGNANTWATYARLSGWNVSATPIVGAIGQTNFGFLGHVGVIESVSADGSQIKYSDMNGLAGWGRVGYSDWVSSTRFQRYIYR